MLHLGDSTFVTKSGGRQEVVLWDYSGPRYTIHGDLINNIQVESATTGTRTLILSLDASSHVLRIPEMAFAEVWVEPPGALPARLCLGRFAIDYWDASGDEHQSAITIHGRGPLGSAVDSPQNAMFVGELKDLLVALCFKFGQTELDGLGPKLIKVYINMNSAYAALRLLGVSLGFVIKEDDQGFRIRINAVEHELQRVMAKPRLDFNDSNMLATRFTKGSPVKARGKKVEEKK